MQDFSDHEREDDKRGARGGAESQLKLFIGGLDYQTTDDELKQYFEKYGEITDVVVMKDQHSGNSRGFGFVSFSESYMVDAAQNDRPHTIRNRTVDTKRAVPKKTIVRNTSRSGSGVKKLFIGGIKEDVNDEV